MDILDSLQTTGAETVTSGLYGNSTIKLAEGMDVRREYLSQINSTSHGFTCCNQRQAMGDRVVQVLGNEADSMSFSSSSDDPEAAAVVVQQLDDILRERVNMEMTLFKDNIHRILSEQNLQFRQAFGLPETPPRSQNEPMHVVPQTNPGEDNSSEDCHILAESTGSDASDVSVHRHPSNFRELPSHLSLKGLEEYNWTVEKMNVQQPQPEDLRFEDYQLCEVRDNCSKGNDSSNTDEHLTQCLVRMLTAASAISEALRRQEYASLGT